MLTLLLIDFLGLEINALKQGFPYLGDEGIPSY